MRINYYEFPENIDAHTRWQNGACRISGYCTLGKSCRDCEHGWYDECGFYKCTKAENLVEGCSIKNAKNLLKQFGGCAWTDHCDRDGSVFETTSIMLTGNNSQFKYNHHL